MASLLEQTITSVSSYDKTPFETMKRRIVFALSTYTNKNDINGLSEEARKSTYSRIDEQLRLLSLADTNEEFFKLLSTFERYAIEIYGHEKFITELPMYIRRQLIIRESSREGREGRVGRESSIHVIPFNKGRMK